MWIEMSFLIHGMEDTKKSNEDIFAVVSGYTHLTSAARNLSSGPLLRQRPLMEQLAETQLFKRIPCLLWKMCSHIRGTAKCIHFASSHLSLWLLFYCYFHIVTDFVWKNGSSIFGICCPWATVLPNSCIYIKISRVLINWELLLKWHWTPA